MPQEIGLSTIYAHSSDIVARTIEDELIIVPLVGGIDDDDNAIFSLNPTGQAIWEQLDGQCSLQDIATILASEFEADKGEIETDVLGLVTELVKRRMLVEVEA